MGTRGAWGFRIDGVDKITYVHSDAYPEGLGQDLISCLIRRIVDGYILFSEVLKQQARALRLVSNEIALPTQKEIDRLYKYADLNVSSRRYGDWYCLLRQTQGDLEKTLEATVMIDSHEFLADSLFCEFAYVINLDDETFEIYKGFQGQPHTKGRYAAMAPSPGSKYYPVAFVVSVPLRNLPADIMDVTEVKELG